ncbi:cytochrome c-type biogenesis protein CcmH [Halomonas desiderata]|uniref:cytochrome c-type biogenesis protein n=1 Tax=Billgrantia desiderata TaxID=52021 RepID=UPI00089E1437|nr:cytochrome c-type biogenesis protein [Halomonas desiderata]MCE8010394.1 cytochrome c-type biogenesis protein CcmH [Halomonas desiderata]NIC35575.1 cytochrome c-type biogenesis protein CcmH [Halomonas desiderata]OUE40351.1 cytochrome C biogenesis protein [Halomonas desiderata SP1]SEG05060.1 cytochrome c-type biogenesis protein CcmH [Halomonas desiderata]
MKRSLFLSLLGLPLWLAAGLAMALAIGQPVEFDNEAQKRQYDTLVRELRCTVCQSETIHESNAELAADMRRRVYDMTLAGHDADAIIEFMVQRYGDYVRYRPPLQANTWLLWASPFLLMFGGALVWWRIVVGRRGMAERPDFTEQERAVLERLRHDA